jgi:hypothetical protein
MTKPADFGGWRLLQMQAEGEVVAQVDHDFRDGTANSENRNQSRIWRRREGLRFVTENAKVVVVREKSG